MRGQTQPQRDEVQTLHHLLALGLVKDFSLAIDGGAHVGTWAAVMAEHFDSVLAFEPTPETYGYLVENLAGLRNVRCINAALMDKRGRVDMVRPGPKRQKLSSRRVKLAKDGEVPCWAINDLHLDGCGLIKLDLEGAEGLALAGARKTIKKYHPVLVVEIGGLSKRFGHAPEAIHQGILALGYREVMRATVDRAYAWGPK